MTESAMPCHDYVHLPANAVADSLVSVNRITNKTQLCVSLSARPSNHGAKFHNYLYAHFGLDFVYKPFAPMDIAGAVTAIRALPIRGAGISMPFKREVLTHVDEVDGSAVRLDAANTIVNTNGHLVAYNTDYTATRTLLVERDVDTDLHVALRGSGGMANAVVGALADHGLMGTIVARNAATGKSLADRYGWDYATAVPAQAAILVNVTPIGMEGGHGAGQRSFSDAELAQAAVYIDAVAMPVETPTMVAAQEQGLTVITGGDIIALQAADQFRLYTGITPTPAEIAAAEAFASA